ncbi:non-ribosomal peptide synthetase [Mastigocoleus testarum]|uniref:Carrier domain-containing protein n=1 Tax=Mastigocoleus testarum BC008 TaxID=371196 RepID=A0A0V8A0R3_9CYAN|nr:non-ribosomal peptide synthetase [Mastigocoleus testarum]KST70376.1 hypothetical protein BC008_45080 [Mastigocoleus testarum BC008]
MEGFQLSPQQKHLWLLQKETQISCSYRSQCAVLIEGHINIDNLRQAFKTIIERHEILRTNLFYSPEIIFPLQVINKTYLPPIYQHDLTSLSPTERELKIKEIFWEISHLPFNLEQDENLHITLAKTLPKTYVLIVSLPAFCADSFALGNLVTELITFYTNFITAEIDQDPMQYADFSEWQNDLLQSEETTQGREYWSKTNVSSAYNFKLPFELKNSDNQVFKPKYITNYLEQNIVLQLKEIAQKYHTSISTLLLTCWYILLWKLTGNSNIIVGTLYDGRPYEELKQGLGLYAKYLPNDCYLEAELEFTEILKQIDLSVEAKYKLQNYFSWAEVELSTDNKKNIPFCQFCFNFEQQHIKKITEKFSLSVYKQISYIDKFKVKLSCIQKDNIIALELHYDSNIYREENIKYWVKQYQTLLNGVIENMSVSIGELAILDTSEQQQLLWKFNNDTGNYFKNQCIHQLFEKQVKNQPDNLAIVFEEQTLTYAQLNARANQLARHLQKLGVAPEVIVGICMERSLETIVGILAILKAGGAYVPLDPALPKSRLAWILENTQPLVILTEQQSLLSLPESQARVVDVDQDWDIVDRQSVDNLGSEVTPDNLVYVIYTSGSTGKPKGVAVEHQQLLNYVYGIVERLDIPHNAKFALVSTLAADLGNTVIFPSLCTGGSLHIISQERATNPDAFADYCYSHGGIDYLKIVPTHLRALLNSCKYPEQILPKGRLILGGEVSDWGLIDRVQTLAPNCMIVNHYGPTEATVGVLTYQVEQEKSAEINSATVPLGHPLPNTQVFLLDSNLRPVPIGVAGEIYIGGANLTRGYLNQPKLTAASFIDNPFHDLFPHSKAYLYKTGDLARYLPDGKIEFLGRIDQQVKIRGFRIELGEIESALQQHPKVEEAVAKAFEKTTDEQRLVVYFVPDRKSTPPKISELRSFLQERLPNYMLPSTFVMLKALPMMANGKLDCQALPKPNITDLETEESFVAPKTPEQKLLADIWCEVLGQKKIGIHDNFFELGGDSILSIQIVSKANQAGLSLKPMQLFQYKTIAELGAVASQTSSVCVDQGLVKGAVNLTPIQRWFFEQDFSEPHHWNMSIMLEISQVVMPDLLEKAINYLLEHHDVLRLYFKYQEMAWQPMTAGNNLQIPIDRIDLSSLPQTEQISAIEIEAWQIQASLDLSTAPLMKVALFDLGCDQEKRLLIVIHHLLVDGVSWRILLEDLQKAYQQLSCGETIQLAKKTTSFKYWSEQLSRYARSQKLQQELDYWLNQNKTALLPKDYFDGPNTVDSARVVSVSLTEQDTQTLLQQVPAVYHTQINDLLLTTLVQTFRQWTGENTLFIELEGHGRELLFDDVDLSRTIGWFTTRFPVVLSLKGIEVIEASEATEFAVKSIKEQLRKIPNRGIGYGLLRYMSEDLTSIEKLTAITQPEISFNYLGQFDQVLSESAIFRLAKNSNSTERSLTGNRPHLIAIDGIVLEGKLQLHWTYSENIHQKSTIENLAQNFIATLKQTIHHCLGTHGGCGYTPSDFPLIKLEQQQIDLLSNKFNNIEDIYSLSPMQQGMLYHCLYTPRSGIYCQQKILTLKGNFHLPFLEKAWQQVLNRHPSLRTIFIWEGLDEPIQIVLSQVEVAWEVKDWSDLSSQEREEKLQAYLQTDLQRGFSLEKAPLMRVTLVRINADTYEFIWSHHHLILDGWCNSIIFKEFQDFYQALHENHDLHLEDNVPYRNYIGWLQKQHLSQSETFWRKCLKGIKTTTKLGISEASLTSFPIEQEHGHEEIQLSMETTYALQSFAKQHQITLNTIIQGAWALLLSRYSGEEDILFGTIVSGRTAAVPRIESIVGLLINILPVRVRVNPHISLINWLNDLQKQQTEMLQHEYTPLVMIREWSEIPRGTSLFESFITFENYPVDNSLWQENSIWKIINVRSCSRTNYPLNLRVEMGSTLSMHMTYHTNKFDVPTIRRILNQLQIVLANIPKNPTNSLLSISLNPETENQQLINSFNVDLDMI